MLCAHNDHPEQPLDPYRPTRVPTLHFRFHKIRLYMRIHWESERGKILTSLYDFFQV